jgi:hypothetical protein
MSLLIKIVCPDGIVTASDVYNGDTGPAKTGDTGPVITVITGPLFKCNYKGIILMT